MGDTTTGTCESCGRDGEDVVRVTRLYVTPESWDTAGKVEVGDEEWWCFVCRTHYPHAIEGQDTGWPAPG
jgi:thymidine kinase